MTQLASDTQLSNTLTPPTQPRTILCSFHTIKVFSGLIAVRLHSFLILCSYGLIIYHDDIVAVEVVYKDLYLSPGSLSRPLGHWGLGMCCTHYLYQY